MLSRTNILIASLLISFLWRSYAADGNEIDKVRQLRDQRLYRAAERLCLDLLRKPGLPDSDSASITAELLTTYLNHALDAIPTEQSKLWDEIETTVSRFKARHNENTFHALVDVQFGIGLVLKAEIERLKRESGGDLQPAIVLARAAIDQLKNIDQSISNSLQTPDKNGLSIGQLQLLRFKVQFEIGRAFYNLALCYPNGSADNVNALTRSLAEYEPLARLQNHSTLAISSRLAEAKCHRRLTNHADANARLVALESKPTLSDEQRLAVVTERARLHLARREYQASIHLLDTTTHASCRDPGIVSDFHLAKIEAYASRIAVSKRMTEIETLNRKSRQTWDLMKQQSSMYWSQQAELLIASENEPKKNLTLRMKLRADQTYRDGKIDQAIDLYARAAQESLASDDLNSYVSLHYKAAVIEHQQGRFREAMTRMVKVSTSQPTIEGTEKCHFLAIVDAAQLASSNQQADVENYIQLLQQHIESWPRDLNTNQVRFWLAGVREREGRWNDAINSLIEISIDWPKYDKAIGSLRRCYNRLIDASTGKVKNNARTDAVQYFTGVARQVQSDHSLPLTILNLADLSRLEVQLLHRSNSLAANEQELESILETSRTTSDDTIARDAARLLLLCYALQRKTTLATELFPFVADCSADQLVPVAKRIDSSLKNTSPNVVKQGSALILKLSTFIQGAEELSSTDRMAMQILHAKALSNTGEQSQSVALLQDLVKQVPRDLELRVLFARVLQKGNSPEQMQAALDQWRAIGNGSKPASSEWFQARYETANCLYELGRREKAADLIRLTSTLHPTLGGPDLKSRFVELLAKSELENSTR